MIERRKFIRLQAPIGVVYKKRPGKGKAGKPSAFLLKNIGGGGVRILVKEDVRQGDTIDLRIEIPNLKKPIHAICEVVWFARTREDDREIREAGLRFCEIEPRDLHRILEYVHTAGLGH